MKRLIIGISGASGAIYGVRLLQVLQHVEGVETHLIISNAARQTLALETDYSVKDVQEFADVVHDFGTLRLVSLLVHLRPMAWLFYLAPSKHCLALSIVIPMVY